MIKRSWRAWTWGQRLQANGQILDFSQILKSCNALRRRRGDDQTILESVGVRAKTARQRANSWFLTNLAIFLKIYLNLEILKSSNGKRGKDCKGSRLGLTDCPNYPAISVISSLFWLIKFQTPSRIGPFKVVEKFRLETLGSGDENSTSGRNSSEPS